MNNVDSITLCKFLVMDYDRYCAGSFDQKVFQEITSDDIELEYTVDGTTTHAQGRKDVTQLILDTHAYNTQVKTRKGYLYSKFSDSRALTLELEIKEKAIPGEVISPCTIKEESTFEFVSEKNDEGERYKIQKVMTCFSRTPISFCKKSLFSSS